MVGVVAEDDTLDFKNHGYQKSIPEWRNDLLTDIAAFANARGGLIICGMDEEKKTALALSINGLGADYKTDPEIRRLEQAANSGIEPAVPGLRFEKVPLSDPSKANAIVIRVPRSFAAPHRIKQTRLFPIRRSIGNGEMTIEELRRAFNLAGSYIEQLRQFRQSRLNAVINARIPAIPVRLNPGMLIVCQSIPLGFVDNVPVIDIGVSFGDEGMKRTLGESRLKDAAHALAHPNLDGFAFPFAMSEKNGTANGYCQVFRTGAIVGASDTGWHHPRARGAYLCIRVRADCTPHCV
ncbi:MAG: ATP-binding protein [Chloroflexi bacterium]|nr:ATP-binding protein [Chloroflexota bacterium]